VLLVKGMVAQMWVAINSSCCWFHTNIVSNNNANIWFPHGKISMVDSTFYFYFGLARFPTFIDY